MRASVTPLTPKLMHMPHNSTVNIDFTVAAADIAASVLHCCPWFPFLRKPSKHICSCMQALYQFCQDTLSSKVTTLEADIAELQSTQDSAPRNERHMLALQFRIGKKQLLKSCLWQYDPQQLVDT